MRRMVMAGLILVVPFAMHCEAERLHGGTAASGGSPAEASRISAPQRTEQITDEAVLELELSQRGLPFVENAPCIEPLLTGTLDDRIYACDRRARQLRALSAAPEVVEYVDSLMKSSAFVGLPAESLTSIRRELEFEAAERILRKVRRDASEGGMKK